MRVLTGADNIGKAQKLLHNRRVGLMTNATGVDSGMRRTVDIINESYNLTALFACEHGIRGEAQAGDAVKTTCDSATGVPVFSLYGSGNRLTDEMLSLFDVFVFDMQDVGARFYTYLYSLSYALEDVAKAGKTFVVFDRPAVNGGDRAEGVILDERLRSFVGEYAMPTSFGLTIGEYARWVNTYLQLDADLHVIPLSGWSRGMRYSETGLPFIPPSPNCATLHAAAVYPGTCIFEGTNVSEGRGTVLPFEYIGAPYINAAELTGAANSLRIPGAAFSEACFTPWFGKYTGEHCEGVLIHVTDKDSFSPFAAGLMLLDTVRKLYGEFDFGGDGDIRFFDRLLGTDAYRLGKITAEELINTSKPAAEQWHRDAESIMLYR